LSANWLFGIKPDLQFSLKTGSLLYIILLYYVWLPNDISHIGLVIDRKKFFFSGVKPSLQLLWRVFSPLFWEIMFYNKNFFSNLIENRSPICSIWNWAWITLFIKIDSFSLIILLDYFWFAKKQTN
jgi:hypothetical protein